MRPLIGGMPLPSKRQALAAADEEARQRDQKQLGAIALCRPRAAGDISAELYSIEAEASRHSQTVCAASHSVSRT